MRLPSLSKRFREALRRVTTQTTELAMVKINEVAEAAGVSISTVSYALSGKRPISAETRRRIEEAVRELGYSPNAGARMLAGSRTSDLRADRAASQGHPRSDPHGLRARDRCRRPPQRLRHPPAHRGGREGGHEPRCGERPGRRDPGAGCRARRRAGRARAGHRHPDDLHRRAQRPRGSGLRRPGLRGRDGARGRSARRCRAHARSG